MSSGKRRHAGFKYLHGENKNGMIEKQRNCHDPRLVILPIYVWRLVRMGGYRAQKKNSSKPPGNTEYEDVKIKIWH